MGLDPSRKGHTGVVSLDMPPGAVSKRFVAHLVRGVDDFLPQFTKLFSDGYGSTDTAWHAWVQQQPSTQRSYLRSIRDEGRWYAMAAFLNGVDHGHAISDSLHVQESGVMRAWSYLTLARTASEAFVRCAVITDARHDSGRKAGTAAGVVLWGNNEQVKLSRSDNDLATVQAEKQLEAFERKLARAGFAINRDGKKRPRSVSRSGATTNIELDVTGETAARVPELPSPYRFGSAVAHSGAWFLGSSIHVTDDGEPSLIASPDLMLVSVVTVLFSAFAAVRAVLPKDPLVDGLREELMRWNARALGLNRTDHRRI